MESLFLVALLTVILGAWLWFVGRLVERVTVFDYQRAVLYRGGRFVRLLEPGQYWLLRPVSRAVVLDIRRAMEQVTGQEMLTRDQAPVKLTLTAEYQITDPLAVLHQTVSYNESLHQILQLGLREAVGALTLDQLLADRAAVGEQVTAVCAGQAAALGLQLHRTAVRDLMLPGDLKKAFADVVKAQKEGQATLERARGETAALRSLANAARMMEEQPVLLQLRWMQAIGQSSGNTVVVGTGEPPLPGRKAKPEKD